MSSIDYGFKAVVLKNYSRLLTIDKQFRYLDFIRSRFLIDGVIPYGYDNMEVNDIKKSLFNRYHIARSDFDYYYNNFPKEMKEAQKINHATYNRNSRLNTRIKFMLSVDNCDHLFLTLTFRNDVLSNTTPETRRRYITRFLKDNCDYYVANKDFGKKNKREHFHAVVNCPTIIDHKQWPYGAINFEHILTPNNNAISKYINKLTNHAIKETTKRSAIIYSNSLQKYLQTVS